MYVHLTWVTDTGVSAPLVHAVAVLRADVGVAGVGQVTAVLNTDLQTLLHVDVARVGRGLSHPHTLEHTHKHTHPGTMRFTCCTNCAYN